MVHFLQWSSWSSGVANWEGSDPVMEKSIGNGDLMDVNGDLMGFDWDTLW